MVQKTTLDPQVWELTEPLCCPSPTLFCFSSFKINSLYYPLKRNLSPITLSSDFSSLYFQNDYPHIPQTTVRAISLFLIILGQLLNFLNTEAIWGRSKGGKKPRSSLKKEVCLPLLSFLNLHHHAQDRIIAPFFLETVLFLPSFTAISSLSICVSLAPTNFMLLLLPITSGAIRNVHFHFLSLHSSYDPSAFLTPN